MYRSRHMDKENGLGKESKDKEEWKERRKQGQHQGEKQAQQVQNYLSETERFV